MGLLSGSWVALVTPMTAEYDIDWASYETLLSWHATSGTQGIVLAGTTGESATLTDDERTLMVQRARQVLGKKMPLMVATGSNCTRTTVARTKAAKAAGADAALLVLPYYNRPTQAGLKAHFTAVADAVDLPQVLYNVPSRTASDLSVSTFLSLAEHPHIQGIKDATADMGRLAQYKDAVGKEVKLFSGDDATALSYCLSGGHGVISVTANVAPRAMASMVQAALAQDIERATALDDGLKLLHQRLFIEPNPIPTKWVLKHLGKLSTNMLRLPLLPLEKSHESALKEAVEAIGEAV